MFKNIFALDVVKKHRKFGPSIREGRHEPNRRLSPPAGSVPMNPAVTAYLGGLDAHLAGVGDLDERIRLLEGERARVDRLERALGQWAICDRNLVPQPTRFSAFDLALLHGALTLRLEAARNEAGPEPVKKAAQQQQVINLPPTSI